MANNLPGYNRPVFVARVLQNEKKYVMNYPDFDGVIMDANIANHYGKVWAEIMAKRSAGGIKFLMVDPNTAKMEHRVCVQKMTYQKLPYCPEVDGLIPDDFLDPQHGAGFSSEFASQVITTEVELGADILLTPYFVAPSLSSPWYQVNLNLARLSRDVVNEIGYDKPLYASVCISLGALQREDHMNQLIKDLSELPVDGYYIMVEGFADRSSSTLELASVRQLVEALAKFRKPIINAFIDAYGLFLSGYGSSGFCAGICWLETYNEEAFTAEIEGRSPDTMRERFIYIPETFIKFPVDRSQLIYETVAGLGSKNAKYLHQVSNTWVDRARYHFLDQRFAELSGLTNLSLEDRKKQMRVDLDRAIALCTEIDNRDIQVRAGHLTRWKDSLDI